MILTHEEYQELGEFLTENSGSDLAVYAVRAWEYYGGFDKDLDSYVVIKVGSYYAVTRIIDAWLPIEVCTEVQPFDEERIYPLQRVQKKIDWVY